MNKILIVLPDEVRLDYLIDDIELVSYHGEFPLYEVLRRHIIRHGYEPNGARIFEVISQEHQEDLYIHLTTFNH